MIYMLYAMRRSTTTATLFCISVDMRNLSTRRRLTPEGAGQLNSYIHQHAHTALETWGSTRTGSTYIHYIRQQKHGRGEDTGYINEGSDVDPRWPPPNNS